MDFENTTIETKRIKLISISDKYINDIFHEFTPEIVKYMSVKAPVKIEETADFIKSAKYKMGKGIELQVVILKIENDEFIGLGGIHKIDTGTPEPGIWIKKDAQGKGYGIETVHALKKWADENIEFDFIRYPVFKINTPSRKIAESLGGVIKNKHKAKNGEGEMFEEIEYWIYPKLN